MLFIRRLWIHCIKTHFILLLLIPMAGHLPEWYTSLWWINMMQSESTNRFILGKIVQNSNWKIIYSIDVETLHPSTVIDVVTRDCAAVLSVISKAVTTDELQSYAFSSVCSILSALLFPLSYDVVFVRPPILLFIISCVSLTDLMIDLLTARLTD